MTPRQRLLLAALALVPLLLMLSTSDPHRQWHHELALKRDLDEPQGNSADGGGLSSDASARSSSRVAGTAESGRDDSAADASVSSRGGNKSRRTRRGGASSGMNGKQEEQRRGAARGDDGERNDVASGDSEGHPTTGSDGGNQSSHIIKSNLEGGKIIAEGLKQQEATTASDGTFGDAGAVEDLSRPPDPLFYAAEGGVEARQLDAPEDPFLEEMRQWLPPAESLPSSLGRCAVVGNSATLRGAKHGQEVDSADAVIRVNQAPSGGGASADVGSRTTLRLLNMKWTEVYSSPSSRDWGRASVVHAGAAAKLVEADPFGAAWLVSARTRGSILARLSARKDVAERYRKPSPLLLRKAFIGWVHNSLAAFSGGSSDAKAQPSTGLMAVFLAMRLCSDVQVFGFSGQVCRGAQHCSKAAHYWSAQSHGGWIDADRLVTHPAHKFSLEGRLLCALAKATPPRGVSGLGNATLAVHWDGNGPPPGC